MRLRVAILVLIFAAICSPTLSQSTDEERAAEALVLLDEFVDELERLVEIGDRVRDSTSVGRLTYVEKRELLLGVADNWAAFEKIELTIDLARERLMRTPQWSDLVQRVADGRSALRRLSRFADSDPDDALLLARRNPYVSSSMYHEAVKTVAYATPELEGEADKVVTTVSELESFQRNAQIVRDLLTKLGENRRLRTCILNGTFEREPRSSGGSLEIKYEPYLDYVDPLTGKKSRWRGAELERLGVRLLEDKERIDRDLDVALRAWGFTPGVEATMDSCRAFYDAGVAAHNARFGRDGGKFLDAVRNDAHQHQNLRMVTVYVPGRDDHYHSSVCGIVRSRIASATPELLDVARRAGLAACPSCQPGQPGTRR